MKKFRRLANGIKGKGNLNRNVIKLNHEKVIILGSKEAAIIIETTEKLGIQLTRNKEEVLRIVNDQLLNENSG